MNTRITLIACSTALSTILLAGCDGSNTPSALKDNDGSTLTTRDGRQITEDMLVGKWDLDGERTNTANGHSGVVAIPSDVVKDVLGKGWRFERGGVLRTDQVVGSKPGTWRIEGANTLAIDEGGDRSPKSYKMSFRDGFLYLQRTDGSYIVFEKDKFFGF